MQKPEFAKHTLDLLCEYAGEDKVFDALVRRWGIEELFEIVSRLMKQKNDMSQPQEEGEAEDEHG